MTNREYLKTLNDEEVSNVIIKNTEWCNSDELACTGYCEICFVKWLERERKTEVKAGQVRKINGVLILIASVREDYCIAISQVGTVVKISESAARKFEITNVTEEEFMRRLFENL